MTRKSRGAWKKIPDERVRSVWVKDERDDCGDGPDTVFINPDWYEENGTPICCWCGEDMVYSHTEIMVEDETPAG